MSGIINLMEELYIGEPIVLRTKSDGVFGRIVGFEGTDFIQGIFPIVVLMTPHGTKITTGRVRIERADKEDLERLEHFEDLSEDGEGIHKEYLEARTEWDMYQNTIGGIK